MATESDPAQPGPLLPLAPQAVEQAPIVAEPPKPVVLLVDRLSKRYEDKVAVEGLSLTVHAGEILGLVGPNGAGKTTTLRSLVGVLPIKEGRVEICGFDLSSQEAAAKRCLAWVPDDPAPFDALTVWEHLEFTAALYSVREWVPRAEELLARFELTEKRDALGGELSRGMRQKLAFCCAWLVRPRLVLLDEPLSGLDPRAIRYAKQAILDLAAEGSAVILSSHLLVLIEELAHRILILDRGRRIFLGTLPEARATLAPSPGSSLEEIFMAATGRGADGVAAPPVVRERAS
ncbi:MAG: ABC transporter ATP-binding protein [Planctomycetes bacterium]|nr:ABC transporter ATP-binding protein [Planctomycetota bacterium]